jgi:hypothetical protein
VTDTEPVITVNCVDGPCQGLQRMDIDSQRILNRTTGEPTPHVYQLSDHSTAGYVDAYYWGRFDSDQAQSKQL